MSNFVAAEITQNSEEISVSNLDDLITALQNADGGETILLESGDYGDFFIARELGDFMFPSEVTIKSADAENPATFNTLWVRHADNITFDGINVDTTIPEGEQFVTGFTALESSNITIKNSYFDGDVARNVFEDWDGYPIGRAIEVNLSDGVTLENNEITNYSNGVFVLRSDDFSITDSEIHGLSNDGVVLAEVQGALIENNNIHDFTPNPNAQSHLDFIQIFSNGTDHPTTDVTIIGNVLDSGEGSPTQSIFISNELFHSGVWGEENFFQNITITDNLIYNSNHNGINVNGANNVVIENNTVLENQFDYGGFYSNQLTAPLIFVQDEVTNATVANNVVERIVAQDDLHKLEGNVLVQRDFPDGENYIGDLFVNGLANGDATLTDLTVLPGTVLEGVGSSFTQFDPASGATIGYASHEVSTGLLSQQVTFAAEGLLSGDGSADLSSAEIVWDFGDGNAGFGLKATHVYNEPGFYTATATVTLANGEQVEISRSVEVRSPLLAQIDAENGIEDISARDHATFVGDNVNLVSGQSGQAIDLNNDTVLIPRSPDFEIHPELTFGLDFKIDVGSDGGVLLHQNAAFTLEVGLDSITLRVFSDQGAHSLKASALGIGEDQWHSLAFTVSGESGEIKLFLDGEIVASLSGLEGADFTGPRGPLYFGDPFGQAPFDGLVDNFVLVSGAVDDQYIPNLRSLDLDAVVNDLVESQRGDVVIEDVTTVTDATVDTTETVGEVDVTMIDPETITAPVPTPEPEPVISLREGTEENDRLFGNAQDEVFIGFDGRDDIRAGAGNDRAEGGAGNDSIVGQDGDDWIDGGEGNDAINGGSGADTLFGGTGDDSVIGADGDDKLFGGDGNDILGASSGNNYFDGGAGRDRSNGGSGDDIFVFDDQDLGIYAGAGVDTIVIESEGESYSNLNSFAIHNVERIDAENDKIDVVELGHYTLRSRSSEAVTIDGDAGDVIIFDVHGSYEVVGTKVVDEQEYVKVNSVAKNGTAREFFFDSQVVVFTENGGVIAGAENFLGVSEEIETYLPEFLNNDFLI